jgi:hypothetical protein
MKGRIASNAALLALLAVPHVARPAPITAAEMRTLAAPEPGASTDDYQSRTVTLRVFGVQHPGTPEAFATVADATTWATRDYRVGDTIGRSLVVRAVEPDALVLASGEDEIRLGVNVDVAVRVVEHAFDTAVAARGGHDYDVDAGALSRARARYGTGSAGATAVLDGAGVKLGALAPAGVLARLGFQAGDVLWTFDGQPIAPQDLDRVVGTIASGGTGPHAIDLSRGGSRFTAVYRSR